MTTPSALVLRVVTCAPMRVVGLEGRHGMADRSGIPDQWRRFVARLGEVEDQVDPATFGLVYDDGGDPDAFRYVAGVMVAADAGLPPGFAEYRLPARRHAVFTHHGSAAAIPAFVARVMTEWLPASGLRLARDPRLVEVYGSDFDPVALAGTVEIWMPLEGEPA